MSTNYFMREALAQAHRDDLLAEAAERRRADALPGKTRREQLAEALVTLAVRLAPATAEGPARTARGVTRGGTERTKRRPHHGPMPLSTG